MDDKGFGLKLREMRINAGKSATDCAFVAKIDRSYWGQIERGFRKPSEEVQAALLAAVSRAPKSRRKLIIRGQSGAKKTEDAFLPRDQQLAAAIRDLGRLNPMELSLVPSLASSIKETGTFSGLVKFIAGADEAERRVLSVLAADYVKVQHAAE